MVIAIQELEKLVLQTLQTEYTAYQAEIIKDVLMFGELSGKPSHGVLRLLRENYGVFPSDKKGEPEYIKKTKVSTLIDGKGNVGMLVGSLAMQEVIRIGKEQGIGVVGTKGSINTTGSLSYYVEQIAKQDLIGIIYTQCSPMMSAFGSKKALFGTNPIAYGIPAYPHPFIFDMSTAAITYGAIAKAKSIGMALPPNVAIDSEGEETTDPEKAIHGASLPFDNSYKSSGLAMIIEIVGSLWTGASFAGLYAQEGWGNVYMAFSPNLLSDTETFKKKTQECVEKIRIAQTKTGEQIRIPGEHTRQIRENNLKKGKIEIEDSVYEKILRLLK